jgi:DNA polymerase III subunit beta
MKIVIIQNNLKKALMAVSNISSKNINLPILNNVLLRAIDGKINLIATNLEIGITYDLRGKVEREGSIALDAKTLLNYVSLLPNQKVVIEQINNNVSIICENFQTTVNGSVADEFPIIPEITKGNIFKINSNKFKNALSQVIFSASLNDSRIELSGILMRLGNDTLTLAATDSVRLAEKKIELLKKEDVVEDSLIILPARTAQELIRIVSGFSDEDESVDNTNELIAKIGDTQISMSTGPVEIVSRLIEGRFPDYQQIIPANFKSKITLNKNELTRAVKAASLFSKNEINDVVLFASEKENKMDVYSSGQKGECRTKLIAEIEGGDSEFILNFRYLLEGLGAINSEKAIFDLVDGTLPCVLKGEGHDDYKYIIMPIKR